MSRLAVQMDSLAPPTNRERMRRYSQRLVAQPGHDANEHARRTIRGELWRRSLAKRPIPRHRALIPHAGKSPPL